MFPMSERPFLFLYRDLGALKICIPPGEVFFSVPMVVASRQEMGLVYGNEALAADNSWQLTWLEGSVGELEIFRSFFDFVFQQPVVLRNIEKCDDLLLAFDPVLVASYNIHKEYFQELSTSLFLPSLANNYSRETDYLSLFGRNEIGVRYGLIIRGDYTRMRHCSGIYDLAYPKVYVKVGFDTMVNLFIKLLCEKGYDFTVAKDRLLCYNLVMDCCYVALDFDKEMERIEKLDEPLHEITMEDGTVLELGKECIVAPEVLFNPGLAGIDEDGIMSLFRIYDVAALSALPPLILSGGCATSLNGLSERIQKEFTKGKNVDLQIMKSNPKEDALRWHEWLICTEFGS